MVDHHDPAYPLRGFSARHRPATRPTLEDGKRLNHLDPHQHIRDAQEALNLFQTYVEQARMPGLQLLEAIRSIPDVDLVDLVAHFYQTIGSSDQGNGTLTEALVAIRSQFEELMGETRDFLSKDFEELAQVLTRGNPKHAAAVIASCDETELALQQLRDLCKLLKQAANGKKPEDGSHLCKEEFWQKVEAVCNSLRKMMEAVETKPQSADEKL